MASETTATTLTSHDTQLNSESLNKSKAFSEAVTTFRDSRQQTGNILTRKNGDGKPIAFHLRYYEKDNSGKLKLKSVKLCDYDKDKKQVSDSCKVVKQMAEEWLRKYVNGTLERKPKSPASRIKEMTIREYFEDEYLPFVKKHKRHSTALGYEQVWGKHLKPLFADMRFSEFPRSMGSQYLKSLLSTHSKATLKHIKFLASGIFASAIDADKAAVDFNVWRNIRLPEEAGKEAKATQWYSTSEVEAVVNALNAEKLYDCALLCLLCFYLGLRISEAIALKWDDWLIQDGRITLRLERSFVRRQLNPFMKNNASRREAWDVTDSNPALFLAVEQYKDSAKASGKDTEEGWMFPNVKGTLPADHKEIVKKKIAPCLKKGGLEWKGFHAFRRGIGTEVSYAADNPNAVQGILRHKSLAVSLDFYKKVKENEGLQMALSAMKGKGFAHGLQFPAPTPAMLTADNVAEADDGEDKSWLLLAGYN